MIDYKSIGRRISFYRKKKGLTQAAFSEILGVSESYVSQIERGIAKVSLVRLDEIAEVLETDIVLLISNHVIHSENAINSEISEITKCWPEEKMELLIKLLLCANEHYKSSDKQ